MRFVGEESAGMYVFITRFQDRPFTVTNHQLLELHIPCSSHVTMTHDQEAGVTPQLPGLNAYTSVSNTIALTAGRCSSWKLIIHRRRLPQ